MDLDRELALTALTLLDEKLSAAGEAAVTLAAGGGGAIVLEYGYDGKTEDIDAVPLKTSFEDLRPYMHEVAKELKIPADWLNPYYQAYTIYLPQDSTSRMRETFKGKLLTVLSLGPEDLLIMKLMAGRAKDRGHIVHLFKQDLNLSIVEARLEELKEIYPKEASRALDLLDDYSERS